MPSFHMSDRNFIRPTALSEKRTCSKTPTGPTTGRGRSPRGAERSPRRRRGAAYSYTRGCSIDVQTDPTDRCQRETHLRCDRTTTCHNTRRGARSKGHLGRSAVLGGGAYHEKCERNVFSAPDGVSDPWRRRPELRHDGEACSRDGDARLCASSHPSWFAGASCANESEIEDGALGESARRRMIRRMVCGGAAEKRPPATPEARAALEAGSGKRRVVAFCLGLGAS